MRAAIIIASIIIHNGLTQEPINMILGVSIIFLASIAMMMDAKDFIKFHRG